MFYYGKPRRIHRMNKDTLFLGLVGWAALSGGLFVTLNAASKRVLGLNNAKELAKLDSLKEGDVVEIARLDRAIPFVKKSTYVLDISMYMVVKIKKDGSYKMRYISSRGATKNDLDTFYIRMQLK